MNTKFDKGRLYIGDKEVATVIFKDGTTQEFPIVDSNIIESNGGKLDIKGDGNIAIQGNNPGSVITIGNIFKADFK
jgi:hypothetical protein